MTLLVSIAIITLYVVEGSRCGGNVGNDTKEESDNRLFLVFIDVV